MADFRAYEEVTIGVNGSVPSLSGGGAEALLARFNAFLSNVFDFRLSPVNSTETEFSFGDDVDITPVLGGIIPTGNISPPFIDYSGTDSAENLYLADTDTGLVSAAQLEQWRLDLNEFIETTNTNEGTNHETFDESLDGESGVGSIISNPLTVVFYNGSTPTASNTTDTGDLPVCFAAGTLIATPTGEVAVETLCPGDMVLTAGGRPARVAFLGHQTMVKAFTPREWFCPVRIRAGALAEGLPRRDLVVTADHGVCVGKVLANAGALVNGTSIVRESAAALAERVVYYHVATEEHALILAEGVAAETFLDGPRRRVFDNAHEYVETGKAPVMLAHPRALSRRQLPAEVVRALDERAVAIGAVPERRAS